MMLNSTSMPSGACRWALLAILLSAAHLSGAEPRVVFTTLEAGKPLAVEVQGVPALRDTKESDWPAILSVRVAGASSNLLGRHSLAGDVLRFESRYPPSAGLTFHATADLSKVTGVKEARTLTAEATLPKPRASASTRLTAIYPSSDLLPENQLRFYLHFSAPMRRGDSYQHVRLLDQDGKEVEAPFLELGEELWDPQRTRFTLLLHPGRVKRGLKPREDLGPILEEGKQYTLVVDAAWPDAAGNPIKSGMRKSFRVGAPDETQPDPRQWKLIPPAQAGKRETLRVDFPEPLDHAMLSRVLRVLDDGGKPVAGTINISEQETRWSFTPQEPWKAGRYRLAVDTVLEDRAGNSIARPFELDLVKPRPQQPDKVVELSFDIK